MASLIPALRQISPTAVPSSPCRRMKAICASVNLDLFMVLPRPTARIAHAAKLEFSSKDRSEKSRSQRLGQIALDQVTSNYRGSRPLDDQPNALGIRKRAFCPLCAHAKTRWGAICFARGRATLPLLLPCSSMHKDIFLPAWVLLYDGN